MDAASAFGKKPGETCISQNNLSIFLGLFTNCIPNIPFSPYSPKYYSCQRRLEFSEKDSDCVFVYSVWLEQSTSLDECVVVREPLGLVLIVGSWCSPVQLCLVPLVGAVAAGDARKDGFQSWFFCTHSCFASISTGNCAIISPSEVSAHTAELLHRLIPFYLDNVRSFRQVTRGFGFRLMNVAYCALLWSICIYHYAMIVFCKIQ